MDYEKQIDTIRDCAKSIQIGKLTILTGKNGSGKSLLRKILASSIATTTGTDPAHTVAAVSMESRTNKKDSFSALNAMGIDDPDNPTSAESLYNIDSLVRNVSEERPRYLVIDEPEIGMGEEMVAALAIKLNNMFAELPSGCFGVLIITHNRYLVNSLNGEFINLENMSRTEWLNREIVPTDLVEFEKDSNGLFQAINARLAKSRE